MNFLANELSDDVLSLFGAGKRNGGNQQDHVLRKNLQVCTYPDETKYKIEKAVKQVFHVYPHFHPELIIFNEGGYQKIYIELKGILQIEIKGVAKKIDFYMMLLPDYPRSPPQVRIINKNPDVKVQSFYQGLKSKTDPSSYLLNEKLATTKNWHPSNNLVHVILEGSDLLKNKFPFSKSISENIYVGNGANSWQNGIANKNNVAWENNNTHWNNNGWGNNIGGEWGINGNTGTIPNQNTGVINENGGMRGNINAGNINNSISVAQKLVGREKVTLDKINNQYLRVIDKNQHLDVTKQSLESQQTYLRKQSYQMANFLQLNESHSNLDLINFIQPKDESSEQILNLLSSIKARQDCLIFLQEKFNQKEFTLQDFLKQVRKMEENQFQQKYMLQKCVKVQQIRQ